MMKNKMVQVCKHSYLTLNKKEQDSFVHKLIRVNLNCKILKKVNRRWCISCYHFESNSLDNNKMLYSYTTDKSLAISTYGEKANTRSSNQKLPLDIYQCIALRDLVCMPNNKVVQARDIIADLTERNVQPPNLRQNIGLLQKDMLLSTD